MSAKGKPSQHLDEISPGAATLGREWLGFDEDGRVATVRFNARPEFTNRHGTVLGGFLAAMLDSATGLTLLADLPPHLTAVTTRLDTQFLRPAPTGPLVARARIASREERNATVEAELLDSGGQVVARATATLRVLRRT